MNGDNEMDMSMTTKVCPMCQRDLPIVVFPQEKDGSYREHCIACKKVHIRTEDQLRNRVERFRKHQKRVDTRHNQNKAPGANVYKKYLKDMKKIYKADEQGIRDIMDRQDGMCPICTASLYEPDSKHWPILDRGNLICIDCALALEASGRDTSVLFSLEEYVRSYDG